MRTTAALVRVVPGVAGEIPMEQTVTVTFDRAMNSDA